MRFFCILAGLILTLPVFSASRIIFNNTTETPNASVQLNTAIDVQFDPTGEGGAGSVLATAADDDLACGGSGLEPAQTGRLALVQIDLPTTGSLVYYVNAEFEYDGAANELTVEPDDVVFDITCFSSLIFSDGFQ